MYRKKKDSDHEIPYYRDIPYYDAYDSLGYIVADGEIVSSLNKKKAKKYIVQLQEIMGKEEKNYYVDSWQNSDKLYGVCTTSCVVIVVVGVTSFIRSPGGLKQ